MSSYLMRLICAAVLCALIDAIAGKGSGMRRLTAGIFLTLVAFSLPTDVRMPQLEPERFFREARAAAAEGERIGQDAKRERILLGCEAYIQSKAEDLGMTVSAEVTLDDGLLPCRVELIGTAAPLERQALCEAVSRDLGLMEEDVIWTQSHQSSE